MYKIVTDMANKLVSVEIKGIFDTCEIKSYITETQEIMRGFGHGEAYVLFLFSRMDPVTQDDLRILINALCTQAEGIKKIAVVEGKVVTRMQVRRMLAEVNKMIDRDLDVGRFDNIKDAMKYLFSET